MLKERQRLLEAMISRRLGAGLRSARVLDVGCGRGDWLVWLRGLGVADHNLHGVDLLADRIASAQKAHPTFAFVQANAEEFDGDDASFDLVVCSTLFSSILDPGMATRVARNIDRILAPGGAIIWYDFRYRNPGNPHTRPMTRPRIKALFEALEPDLHSLTLVPPLARRLGPAAGALYPLLAAIPPLRSHLAGLLSRSAERATG
jgi:ubiquinone/menaquinone biosynthesis C-methylase UbiE